MAKKKKFKLSKNQRKLFARFAPYLISGLVGLIIGAAAVSGIIGSKASANLVWAADRTIKVPGDLRGFLQNQNGCQHYRGTDTPTGVGLWGVYQTSQGRFAKIAYGCSWNLDSYIMAVKSGSKWQLLPPAQYFAPFSESIDARKGALPFCVVVEKYKIPADIESFCIKPDGSAQANVIK